MKLSGTTTNGAKNVRGQPEPPQQQNGDDIVKPLEEFKIDLDTQSVIIVQALQLCMKLKD